MSGEAGQQVDMPATSISDLFDTDMERHTCVILEATAPCSAVASLETSSINVLGP